MLTKIRSAASIGLTPVEIETEVNVSSKGFPGFSVVGLATKAVDEARERVKTAIINSDMEFPEAKITVNLAPADIPKEGSAYDLPIALGIISAANKLTLPKEKSYFYGELSLDGSLRHTRGVFLLALLAKEQGVKNLYVPLLCSNEASVIKGINVYPVDNLKNLIKHLRGEKIIKPLKPVVIKGFYENPEYDFGEIKGQEQAKRALTIAAAGGHNVLMVGSPGCGKTMLARALPGILPGLTEKESLEVTKIYSITGNIPAGGSMIRQRPFRSPHHSTSEIGLIGGGSNPRPGEVSLAHRGVLFLDEFAEFPKNVLEALRQPIEDGVVSVSRAKGSFLFPARFMLVAAANPCPCGYKGDLNKQCRCNQHQIDNYQRKLSGPILDRIDIHLNVTSVDIEKLGITQDKMQERSESIKAKIEAARDKQKRRFSNCVGVYCNGDMKNRNIKELVLISTSAERLLNSAAKHYFLSARTYFRLIKVARTIADLDDSIKIEDRHIAEALVYRIRDTY